MSFNFPNSPTEGQIFEAVEDGLTFRYQNGKWIRNSEDAPIDGVVYGRYNATWAPVTTGSGYVPEAPSTSNYFTRYNTTWVAMTWSVLPGKPSTFPPTLPIAQSDVTGLPAALTAKQDTSAKGAVNGYASLDGTAKVPASQLPAYVDDVLEYANLASFPVTGTTGIIYIAVDTSKVYRWSGSVYTEISPSPGSTDAVPEGTNNKYYTSTRAITDTASSYVNVTGDTMTGVLAMPSDGTAAAVSISFGNAGTGFYGTLSEVSGAIMGSQIFKYGISSFQVYQKLMTLASSVSGAGLLIPPGSAPSTPTNGDVWTTSAGMYVRVNGATVGPLIPEAPSDGKQYTRLNGAWSEVIISSLGTIYPYTFGTATGVPPPVGTVRFNNITQNSATIIHISYTNGDSVDIKTYINQRVKFGDNLYLQDRDDSARWKLFEVTGALTDNTTYASIPVSYKAGGTDLIAQQIVVSRESTTGVSPVGEAPIDGQEYARKDAGWTIVTGGGGGGTDYPSYLDGQWNFNTSTTLTSTAAGEIRLNTSPQSSATLIGIALTTLDGFNLKEFLLYKAKTGARLFMTAKSDVTKYAIWNITGDATDQTTYIRFAVSSVAFGANFATGDDIVIDIRDAPGTGTVTAVLGTAPIASSGGTSPTISMVPATTSVDGYLTATDWNTFNGKASLASPVFTGNPTAPTPTTSDNDTSIATTAFVKAQAYATLADPVFTGNPTAPTPATADNDTSIATTAFVKAQAYAPLASPVLTGTPAAPTATAGTSTTQIATTAFVATSFAPLASPTFTGDPKAPTPATSDNDTSIATTAYVQAQGYKKITISSTAPSSPTTNDLWVDTT